MDVNMRRMLLGSLMIATTSLGFGQTYSWSNPAGGDWFTSTNWTGSLRPNATTTAASVFINTAAYPVPGMSPGTQTYVTGQFAVGTLQSANPLVIYSNGTTLNISGNGSTITGLLSGQNYATISGTGNLTLNGGLSGIGLQINLQGGVTVNGTSEFYAGLQLGRATLNGLLTAYGSLVGIENPATPLIAHPITNNGTMRFVDVSSVSNGNLINAPGGVIEKTTGAGSATICSFGGLIPKFTNYGFVRCTSGTLNVSGYGDQRGQWITEGTGRIGIQGEQTLRGGFFGGNANASLTNGSTLTTASNNGNMTLGGLELSDGTVIANSPINITNFTMTGGRLRGPEPITIGGPASVAGGLFETGTTRFMGPTTSWIGGTRSIANTIEVALVLTRSSGGEIGTGGILRNLGTFRTTGGGQMQGLTVNNQGEWIVDNAALGGMFITPNAGNGSFNNNGSVQVLGGTFEMAVGGTSNGSWSNAGTTLTRFGQVSHTFGSSSTFSGSRFSNAGALLDFAGSATLPYLHLSGSTGTELRSQTSLTVEDVEAPSGGQVTLSGEGEIIFNDLFYVGATMYFNGPGATTFAGGVNAGGFGTWLVNRSVNLQGTSSVGVNLQGNTFGEFINAGSLTLSGGSSISNLNFVNVGTLTTGSYQVNSGGTGSFVQGGNMTLIGPGLTLFTSSVHNGTTTSSGIAKLKLDSGNHDFSLGNDNSQADVIMQRSLPAPTVVGVMVPTALRSLDVIQGSRINLSSDLSIGTLNATGLTIGGAGTVSVTSMPSNAYSTVESGTTLALQGGNTVMQQPVIEGTLDLKGAGQRDLIGTVLGTGTIFNRSNSVLTQSGYVDMYPLFKNEGILNLQSGGLNFSMLWNKLHNTGTTNITNLTLNCFQSPNLNGGVFSGGTWVVGPQGRVTLGAQPTHWASIARFIGPSSGMTVLGGASALANVIENDGQISMFQGNAQAISTNLTTRGLIETDSLSSFTLNGALTMPMGELRNAGTMNVTGGVTVNTGTVNLGGTLNTPQLNHLGGVISPGHVGVGQGTITGNLNLNFGSYLALDINSATPGQFDRFQVNGLAMLGGYLGVRIPNGTTIPAGATMPIVTSNSPVLGGFSQVTPGFAVSTQGNTANLITLANVSSLTSISGSVTLQDFQNDPFGMPLVISFSQNGTPMGAITTIIDESGGYFINTHLRGTFDIFADTGSWLRRRRLGAINITDAGLSNINFVLQNGDIDSSGEVDAADIDQVIAFFGTTGSVIQDVDGSLEVDAADIDIVIANFGAVDDN